MFGFYINPDITEVKWFVLTMGQQTVLYFCENMKKDKELCTDSGE